MMMMFNCFRITRVVLVLLFVAVATVSQAELIYNSPTDVPYFSGDDYGGDYVAAKAIDGDLNTFCAIKDDTGGASAPTTGHMIFDMGQTLDLEGVKLTSRNNAGDYTPKSVDFFYFANGIASDTDDIEGDSNLVSIASSTFGRLISGASETKTWDAVSTRYIGMRVNSSYEEGPTSYNYQIAEIGFLAVPVPEPSTFTLLAALCGATMLFWRRRR